VRLTRATMPRMDFGLCGPISGLYCPGVSREGVPMILAYIDPGSGSVLIQVILASCLGGIFVFWNKIKSLFIRKKPEDAPPSEEPKKPE
jgi:hypothetical protein